MKTKTKPHSSKKRSSKKRGSKKGLRGTGASKMAAAKKGFGAVAKPIGIIGGLALSALAAQGIDKIKFLAVDSSAPADKFQIKALVKPALLLAAGVTTAMLTHSKNTPTMQFVNGLGWGFITGGTFNVAKIVLKKNPFEGLSGASEDTQNALARAAAYKSQAEDAARLLEENKFKVELPAAPMSGALPWNTVPAADDMIL